MTRDYTHAKRTIRDTLRANPGASYTVADVLAIVYPGAPFSRSHYVVVQRHLRVIAADLGWKRRRLSKCVLRYFGPDLVAAENVKRRDFLARVNRRAEH